MSSGPDEALAAHELDLVSRAAKGDAPAFDRFFERNAPAVQLLVERLLGPGEAADAVVLEAFQKTVRRLPLLGARNSSPALYVLSTARNGAYAALGRGRPTADGGPLAALLALPSRQRELLALRELGLPEQDCAEVAGIDAGEVGVQVARARLRLTDELEGLSLSTVFADDRAERLLAAEVVRVEGQPVSEALADEISTHADGDSRFAAALSAVRSPSRSVGQLPAVSGPARLAGAAREQAVTATAAAPGPVAPPRPDAAAAAAAAASAAAGAAAAGAASGDVPVDPGVVAGPRAVPRTKSDPYDDQIGDEAAWGIIDDDEGGPFQAPAATAGKPSVAQPSDSVWEDGAGAVSGEEPTQIVGAGAPTPLPQPPAGSAPTGPPGADPALTDPFAGWDDALDWDEEEREWTAGPVAAVPEHGDAIPELARPAAPQQDPSSVEHTIAVSPSEAADAGAQAMPGIPLSPRAPVDLGETRAFDAVAAGLVDPDPEDPLSEGGEGDAPHRRSRWRWLLWLIATVIFFAGVAFATYTVASSRQDSDLPPTSTLDPTTPAQTTPRSTPRPTSTPRASSGSSSSSGDDARSTSGASSEASSGNASSSGSGSGTSSGSGSGTTSSGNTAGAGGGGGGNNSSSGAGGGTAAESAGDAQVVSPGESSSGGSVRGGADDTSGGTTP